MLDTDTKRRINTCRDILVGKVPDPKSQVEQITIALIYKFMDEMDADVPRQQEAPLTCKGFITRRCSPWCLPSLRVFFAPAVSP